MAGCTYTHQHSTSAWENIRAFVVSAELFPPNVANQGAKAKLSDQMAADEAKFKRVLDFLCAKRGKDDVLIIFAGRSRANRRVVESMRWWSVGA